MTRRTLSQIKFVVSWFFLLWLGLYIGRAIETPGNVFNLAVKQLVEVMK